MSFTIDQYFALLLKRREWGFDPLLSRLQIAARSGGLLSGGPPKGFSCST
jgi:hypothetical protein